MQLNKAKFLYILSGINKLGLSKNIDFELTYYSGRKCSEWNRLLWDAILNDETIFGSSIDLYEYYNYCGFLSTIERARFIYNIIKQDSKNITFNEFEIFLKTIYEDHYIQIVNCLENEKIEQHFIEYKEYSNIILNGIQSPHDERDWFFDKYLNS